eukprot:gnl/MRDRNA2_/MRDRNA2_25595_c0_seq1.p1 gnl/MRDRNA2_/MRDRNA2_25595_c0~~gnl/MRDRNA2_/MRDRNA2_25595_c0_seq1.p1  ORF type:complete len:200 (-),score=26.99 gnl/MRDRNA2_/MRDRNA2_25595_c0_seq1:107-706(-)
MLTANPSLIQCKSFYNGIQREEENVYFYGVLNRIKPSADVPVPSFKNPADFAALPQQPLFDRETLEFHEGVSGYQWMYNQAVECTAGDVIRGKNNEENVKEVSSVALALQWCNFSPECQYFTYDRDESTARFCRGNGFVAGSTVRSGSIVGVKPTALTVKGFALFTNTYAACPGSRLIGESIAHSMEDSHSVFNSVSKC